MISLSATSHGRLLTLAVIVPFTPRDGRIVRPVKAEKIASTSLIGVFSPLQVMRGSCDCCEPKRLISAAVAPYECAGRSAGSVAAGWLSGALTSCVTACVAGLTWTGAAGVAGRSSADSLVRRQGANLPLAPSTVM